MLQASQLSGLLLDLVARSFGGESTMHPQEKRAGLELHSSFIRRDRQV
jgi:hypothetical protein